MIEDYQDKIDMSFEYNMEMIENFEKKKEYTDLVELLRKEHPEYFI